jgi:hypothetical protein
MALAEARCLKRWAVCGETGLEALREEIDHDALGA